MVLADDISALSASVQRLSDVVGKFVIARLSRGTFRETPITDWNKFDKLCNLMSSHMTMEQIASFSLTSKVILSYKIDFASSFYDQLAKGLWKKASNGCLYKLDDCEKYLYVEINDNFEADVQKSQEKLRNLTVAHKVFDEMSDRTLSMNQNHSECLDYSTGVVWVNNDFHVDKNDTVILDDEYTPCQADELPSGANEIASLGLLEPSLDSISAENVQVAYSQNSFDEMSTVTLSLDDEHNTENNSAVMHKFDIVQACGGEVLEKHILGNTDGSFSKGEPYISCEALDSDSQVLSTKEVFDEMLQPATLDKFAHTSIKCDDKCESGDINETLGDKRRMFAKMSKLDYSYFHDLVIRGAEKERFSIICSTLPDAYQTVDCIPHDDNKALIISHTLEGKGDFEALGNDNVWILMLNSRHDVCASAPRVLRHVACETDLLLATTTTLFMCPYLILSSDVGNDSFIFVFDPGGNDNELMKMGGPQVCHRGSEQPKALRYENHQSFVFDPGGSDMLNEINDGKNLVRKCFECVFSFISFL